MPTLLVLGGGVAGLPLVHHVMKHTVPLVNDLRVVWVTPDSHHYWNLASVRAVVPGQFSDEKLFIPIAPAIAHYPKDKLELVLGKAEALDPEKNTVVVLTNDGGRRSIPYDTLVIATGASARENMPFKSNGSTEKTQEVLHQIQAQIKAAKTIVVAGGGTTGAETVGEIGFEYSQNGQKEVYFIFDKELPLDAPFTDSVRKSALHELEKLKIKTIKNSKVTNVKEGPNGQKTLEITSSDGKVQTIKADAYIPTTGVVPNTSFVPASLRDSSGHIKQDTFLRTPGYNNIYVVGDAGNLQASTARWAELQTHHLVKSLQAVFTGGKVEEYTIDPKFMAGVTLGRSRATGQMGTMKLFSIMIWWFKARYMGTDYNKEFVAGNRTIVITKNW